MCVFFFLVVQGGYDMKTELDSSSEKAECSFFMKTGTCKYGDNCKYSHPKERMLLSPPPNLFNPVVLPARPVSFSSLSVYFVNISGACGDTNDSAFVVLRDYPHVVTSRPMGFASMEQTASLITLCQ